MTTSPSALPSTIFRKTSSTCLRRYDYLIRGKSDQSGSCEQAATGALGEIRRQCEPLISSSVCAGNPLAVIRISESVIEMISAHS
jgi:hypothetical protein